MKIVKVPSKSNPKITRDVMISNGLSGEKIYKCSCPANIWYRASNGRHGKQICSHIKFVIDRGL
jgi:hypothetical protein